VARWKLVLEYDGAPFVGWQRQDNGPSVAAVLITAVRSLCGETAEPVAAGRTDAGVHASGQVVHLDLAKDLAPQRLVAALNHHLRPWPVAVLAASPVAPDFHARFDAIGRAYRYVILNRRPPPVLDRGRVWHVPAALDRAAMAEAALALQGRHDFTSFRATGCQAKSPVKTLDRLTVEAGPDERIVIRAEARSFLHHQVRNLVGTLVEVGRGRRDPRSMAAILAAKDRTAAGPTAPAHGLCLVRVDYPSS
jgi:tRNA pseudouridine38-40 synthase